MDVLLTRADPLDRLKRLRRIRSKRSHARLMLILGHITLAIWRFSDVKLSPRNYGPRFSFRNLSPELQVRFFRFFLDEMSHLITLLEIPTPFRTLNRDYCDPLLCLAMLLHRLSGTRSTYDTAHFFNVSRSYVSTMTTTLVSFLFLRWGNVIRFNKYRVSQNLVRYSTAIRLSGAALSNCVGFIDGTNREISRPTVAQGIFYSGHKCYHSIKFQSWVTPDG